MKAGRGWGRTMEGLNGCCKEFRFHRRAKRNNGNVTSDRCWALSYDLVFSPVVLKMAVQGSCSLWSNDRSFMWKPGEHWCPECQHPQKITIASTLLCPPMTSVSGNSSCCLCSALIPSHLHFYLLPFFSFPFSCLLSKFSWTISLTL